ncbi:hypothetical protein FZEAL_2316 [Fusarium zealandicum]|uniref:BZIP domain-containing protein n=1 Tax=Fusarium zealandicum TaxID=1053134 RepID=A0A8H4URN6_9HYPO|nr:hypothetical protein FZEAL_2316 [Fusarium zealandicum]
MDPSGPFSTPSWQQWWPPVDHVLPGSSMLMENISPYAQNEPQFDYFLRNCATDNTKYPTAGFDPSQSQYYPEPSTSESTHESTHPECSPISTTTSDRRASSSYGEKQKRKQITKDQTPAKASRRTSTRKRGSKVDVKNEIEDENERAPRRSQASVAATLASPDQEGDEFTRRLQERNRIASNKFRVRKREDAKRLRSDEEDMERINRDLSKCAADLTLQVYQLKMRLLQHTDCNCTLIQNYIANEANRYVKDIGDERPCPP